MDAEALFLSTLDDLGQRVEAADEYSLLRGTALLRQLLMEGDRLVDVVNRSHRLKLRYEVCGRRYTEVVLEDNPVFYSALGGIHRSGSQAPSAELLPLDDFLKTTVLVVKGKRITIGELITYAANVAGGVHLGKPRDAEVEALAEFREVVALGQPVQIAQLRSVILVVLDALDALRRAVEAHQH
jgi:hypothetical protein